MEVLPENVADDQKMAIQVLSDGRDFADQLRMIMSSKGQPLTDSDSLLSAGDLVSKILDSFHKSLLILQIPPSLAADETSQVPAGSCDGGTVKSEELDSGQSSKMVKDRRGCYKRRRISEADIKVSGGQLEDGHAWRKYGQKSILNAKYPRNYYRCTHKFEQGCPATKQVQKTEEDPPMYRTTYYGQHTCRNTSDFNQLLLDSSSTATTDLSFGDSSSNSFLLNFQNKNIIPPFSPNHYNYKQHHSTNSIPSNNSTDYLSSPHIGNTYGSSATLPDQLMSPAASDVITGSRVYSCTTSTTTPDHITVFDDQMMAATANFDDDLDSFFV